MVLSSREFLRRRPSHEETKRIIGDLAAHGDTAMVILAASYLEGALEDLLICRFVPMNSEEKKRLFDSSAGGVLGSLAGKVRVARAFDVIPERYATDLHMMANLRNIFAHSMHTVSFDSAEVSADCAKFVLLKEVKQLNKDFEQLPISGPRGQFVAVFNVLHMMLRFLRGDPSLKFILEFTDGTRTELSSFVEKS